jgi:hypothetical protein
LEDHPGRNNSDQECRESDEITWGRSPDDPSTIPIPRLRTNVPGTPDPDGAPDDRRLFPDERIDLPLLMAFPTGER